MSYVSDLIFKGVRVKSPEDARLHLERVKRALAKMGKTIRTPPKKDEA